MFKAYVQNYYDMRAMAPAGHVMAHSAPFANIAKMGYDPAGKDWTYMYFSHLRDHLRRRSSTANHGPADHLFYILEGYGLLPHQRQALRLPGRRVMWTPGNSDHEMYPDGTANLKFRLHCAPRLQAQPALY
jgi:hypothetical protein